MARTDEAIEKVWDDALAQAQEYRRTNTPPTCSRCGESDWRVSITEPDGRKLHVKCWAEENPINPRALLVHKHKELTIDAPPLSWSTVMFRKTEGLSQ